MSKPKNQMLLTEKVETKLTRKKNQKLLYHKAQLKLTFLLTDKRKKMLFMEKNLI